jgi:AraC family transcriptional regulator
MQVVIRQVPAMRVAAVRHVGPYNQIGAAFTRLNQWADQAGVPPAPRLGVFRDDPGTVAASELRSDAGIVVPEGFTTDAPGIQVFDIPANEYAVATHVGSYEGLGDAWGRFIGEWFPHGGREFGSGPCFEIYVKDCSQVPQEQLVTELYEPVAPARKDGSSAAGGAAEPDSSREISRA